MQRTFRAVFLTVLATLLVAGSAVRADTLAEVADTIGAQTFYDNGYNGSGVIIGNVEAGLTRDDHEALPNTTVTEQTHWDGTNPTASTNRVQSHATQVGGTMVAQDNATTGRGIAYGAELWTGQIATSFGGGGSFSISLNSLLYPLMLYGEIGIGGETAHVINSSWGGSDNTGNTVVNVLYDYLANSHGVTMVASAGNSGQGPGTVGYPGNSWNVITVGAVGDNETVTSFSSGGPTGSFNLAGTRTKPDLVAPGLSIVMPTTGGSSAYATSSGTSFSSPITAASAALLIDYGLDTGRSTDPRLVKAVLMNSATKLAGWSQEVDTHPTTGTVINYTPVDGAQGAGLLNLTRAWDQYTASTGTGSKPTGPVGRVGWDVNTVSEGAPRDYLIDTPLAAGDTITATLAWFMDRTVSGYDENASDPGANTDFFNDSFDDLDLLLYLADINGDATGDPIAASISNWDVNDPNADPLGLDSVEHMHFTVDQAGQYVLRVRWTQELFDFVGDAQTEDYALAWEVVPEPGTIILLLVGSTGLLVAVARRRQQQLARAAA